MRLVSVDCCSQVKAYRTCGNDRAFCEVFISRVLRSSRMSRDLETILSRFSAFEPGIGNSDFAIRLRMVIGKTGFSGAAASLELDVFINIGFVSRVRRANWLLFELIRRRIVRFGAMILPPLVLRILQNRDLLRRQHILDFYDG